MMEKKPQWSFGQPTQFMAQRIMVWATEISRQAWIIQFLFGDLCTIAFYNQGNISFETKIILR